MMETVIFIESVVIYILCGLLMVRYFTVSNVSGGVFRIKNKGDAFCCVYGWPLPLFIVAVVEIIKSMGRLLDALGSSET